MHRKHRPSPASRQGAKGLARLPRGARLPGGVNKKLIWYALASGAIAALPVTAHADSIVYSQVGISLSGTESTSVNLPGGNTMTLGTQVSTPPPPATSFGETYVSWAPSSGGWILGANGAIPLGTSIGFNQAAYSYQQLDYEGYSYTKCTSSGCQQNYNQNNVFPNGQSGYLGLFFLNSGQIYFGWADIYSSVTTSSANAELISYAYNATPDAPILAGETASPVPEPPTLALFATGAVGVLAFLRRRARLAAAKPAAVAVGV